MICRMHIRTCFCVLFISLISACQTIPPKPIMLSSPVPAYYSGPTATQAVPSPTPTVAQLIYPYTIDGLRHHNYQSGNISIVSTLAKTDIYTGYLINYPSDGLTISGILQVPSSGHPPYPVIVMDHGYFNREEYTSGDGTDRAAEYLNMHGYLTVSSDYRSWGKSDIGPVFTIQGWLLM